MILSSSRHDSALTSSDKGIKSGVEEVTSTSTTKALLVSIAVPRVYRVYLPPPRKESAISSEADDVSCTGTGTGKLTTDESAKSSEGSEMATAVVPPKEEKQEVRVVHVNSRPASLTINEHEVGYVEDEDENATEIVEHVVTAEEMATVVKIDPNAEAETAVPLEALLEEQEQKTNNDGENDKPKDDMSVTASSISTAIKTFFGVTNKYKEQVPTSYLNKEQAINIIKEYEPLAAAKEEDDGLGPNTEIKVEELLRLTCRNLYAEGHFYNAPIYTPIQSRYRDGDPDDWVELAVMVKESSIGTIMERLERIGVGSSVGTITILKAELCRTVGIANVVEESAAAVSKNGELPTDMAERTANIEAARAEWKNAASRLRVEQVKEQIYEQAQLSFDFLSLLIIASILAGIGLIVNSVVVIVASMLVSPIMGPVMGMTFGSRVLDWKLAGWSFYHECVALLLAVLVGAIIGFVSSWSDVAGEWPTEEMESRGDVTGLITGIAIAIPSGMGVALSILGNNTASLVGVAISASLLPPAVNAGICWAHAILIRSGAVENSSDADFVAIGAISFALTIVNIVCIWVSGMVMFKIKEVAPSKAKSAFWARDIKVARAIQKGSKGVDLEVFKAGLQHAIEKERKANNTNPRNNPSRRWQKGRQASRKIQSANYGFNMSANPVDDNPIDWEHVVGGPTPLTDDIQYYGLEDMGALLGFDEESEDEEEPRRGLGWFLPQRLRTNTCVPPA